MREEDDWRWQLAKRVTQARDLPPRFRLSAEEAAWIDSLPATGGLPLAATPYYLSLSSGEAGDPIRAQVLPDPREALYSPLDSPDPLGDTRHSPLPRMVHHYRNRVLLLANGECASYCRHCFRRHFAGSDRAYLAGAELSPILDYLSAHDEVEEILVSGGDPLVADDDTVLGLLSALREAKPRAILRLCTRACATLPQRFTEPLVEGLSALGPLWVATQFNHPAELSDRARAAVSALLRSGIPVLNQSVLLRGVNDSAATLAELSRLLLAAGVKPYYLFQGDLASGTAHRRVSLWRGREIYRELSGLVSGLGLPAYAVDLPSGGGKVRVMEALGEAGADGYARARGSDGALYAYPWDEEGLLGKA
jgi:lysine 2,3-aminomutase